MKRVFAHIGFSFAITLIVLNLFSIKAALVIFAITGVAFAVSFVLKKTRKAVSVPLCMFSAFLACAIFITTYYGTFLPCEKLNETTAYSEFYLVDLEQETSSGYSYTVKTVSVDKVGAPQNIKLYVKSKTRINADYYQIITGELKFRLVAENGFDSYGAFGEKVFLTSNLNSYSTTDETIKSPNKYILEIRQSIMELVVDVVGGDSGAIVLALFTGDKTDVSSSVKSNFRDSGASHIMAVSGLHLAVLSGSVYWFLKKIRTPKFPGIFISLAAVLFYKALSGFSKSITRAGVMMIILLAARLF
ncbi:MAG: competence protein ComEC family protein, partial [Eubacterium sp.]|nr:competence protein ComEC family protein [Eubacterium sp.]